MIKHLVRTIRRQPKKVRDNIALVIAGTFTSMVFVVWLYHMPVRNSSITELKDDSSPSFSQFFSDVGSQVAAIKESATKDLEAEQLPKVEESSSSDDEFNWVESIVGGASSTTESLSVSSSTDTLVTASTSSAVKVSAPKLPAPPTGREIRIVTTSASTTVASTTANE